MTDPVFDQAIFDRLGDPFVTTRPGYGAEDEGERGHHEGMGLGFFIAKTLLERSGATVSLANRAAPEHGAIIQLSWPRGAVDWPTRKAVRGAINSYDVVNKRALMVREND